MTYLKPIKVIPGEEGEPTVTDSIELPVTHSINIPPVTDNVVPLRPDPTLQRVCHQCGAGALTRPPSDAPNIWAIVEGKAVWFHPECNAYRLRLL
jgi:hypothetical protein